MNDYRDAVTYGLMFDLIAVFERHGIVWADDTARRKADALVAMARMADAIAKPVTDQGPPSPSASSPLSNHWTPMTDQGSD